MKRFCCLQIAVGSGRQLIKSVWAEAPMERNASPLEGLLSDEAGQ